MVEFDVIVQDLGVEGKRGDGVFMGTLKVEAKTSDEAQSIATVLMMNMEGRDLDTAKGSHLVQFVDPRYASKRRTEGVPTGMSILTIREVK